MASWSQCLRLFRYCGPDLCVLGLLADGSISLLQHAPGNRLHAAKQTSVLRNSAAASDLSTTSTRLITRSSAMPSALTSAPRDHRTRSLPDSQTAGTPAPAGRPREQNHSVNSDWRSARVPQFLHRLIDQRKPTIATDIHRSQQKPDTPEEHGGGLDPGGSFLFSAGWKPLTRWSKT